MNSKIFSNNLFLLIILSAIWGSAFYFIKISVENYNPTTIASMRLIIAAIFLYSYHHFKGYKLNFTPIIFFYIFLAGLIGNFIPFFLISWSEQYIQSNTAGLLLSVAPILTLIFSHFLTKDDKFTLRKFISILIGITGVLFILGFNELLNISKNESNLILPKFAVIVAAFGYVFSAIIAYNLKNINIITLTTYVTISAAVISFPFMIITEFNYTSVFSVKSFLPILYLGLFPTAIAFLLRFYIISRAGPIFLSYVAYLIPVFAILWGFIFLQETISLNTGIGVCFVLMGVFISQKPSEKNN